MRLMTSARLAEVNNAEASLFSATRSYGEDNGRLGGFMDLIRATNSFTTVRSCRSYQQGLGVGVSLWWNLYRLAC